MVLAIFLAIAMTWGLRYTTKLTHLPPQYALTLKNCCNLKAPTTYDLQNSVAATK